MRVKTNYLTTVFIPGQAFPKQTISALTSTGLKNCVALGPDLKNFFYKSKVIPGHKHALW